MLQQKNHPLTRMNHTQRWPAVRQPIMRSGCSIQRTSACMPPPVTEEIPTISGRALSRGVGLMAGMQANLTSLLGPRPQESIRRTEICTSPTRPCMGLDTSNLFVTEFSTATAGTAAWLPQGRVPPTSEGLETTPVFGSTNLFRSVHLIRWVVIPITLSTSTPSTPPELDTAPTRRTTSWTWASIMTAT